MPILGMYGPFPLNQEEIDKRIIHGGPGNYAYGHKNRGGKFVVQYVGRSDEDLHQRISHGIGKYKMFKFSYAKTIKEAFEKECVNYHDFGENDKLDNEIHPDRPKGKDYSGPVCEGLDDE